MVSSEWLVGTAIAGLLLQGVLTYRLLKSLRHLKPVEERVGHFADVLSLLAETTESGFRSMSTEIERLNPRTPAEGGKATTSRIATAARRGDSIQDIVETEQVSEGEVRLRLHLAEQARAQTLKVRQAGAAKSKAGLPDKPRNGVRAKSPNASATRNTTTSAVKGSSVPGIAESSTVHDAKPRQAASRRTSADDKPTDAPMLAAPGAAAMDQPVVAPAPVDAAQSRPKGGRNRTHGSLRA